MKQQKVKRGDVVECNGKFYIFLKSDGKNSHVLEIKSGNIVGELTTVKRKDIAIPKLIPEHLKRYSIT